MCHFKAQTNSQKEKSTILSDALYSHFPCDMKYLGIAVSLKMRAFWKRVVEENPPNDAKNKNKIKRSLKASSNPKFVKINDRDEAD